MKKVFYIIPMFFLLSCSNITTQEKKTIKKNAERLKEYFSEIKISGSAVSDSLNFGHELNRYLKENQGYAIIYLINSECSTCIADFLSFLSVLDKSSINIPLYGILNENHIDLIEYYMEKYDSNNSKKITPIFIKNEYIYPFISIEPHKNVILLKEGRKIKEFTFTSNNLIFN